MCWRNGNKLIIDIAYAGAHETNYSNDNRWLFEKSFWYEYNIVAFKIGSKLEKSF